MPIECLYTQACLDIPERYGFVSAASTQDVGEGLERCVIDGVDVASEGVAALAGVQVEEFGVVVHGGRGCEVARVVDSYTPDRLDMVFEGMRAGCIHEIPHLHR